jgi:hypothetical protein
VRRRLRWRRGQRGQGLVEFALVLPILAVLVVSVVEIGLIYGAMQSIGYGSREGARVASALALGNEALCTSTERDPSKVDAVSVGAVQRILKSPDSGIKMNEVQQIRIFKATSTGAETAGRVNTWAYDTSSPIEIDPGPGTEFIDFRPTSQPWPACDRNNGGATPDSVGVTVIYEYDFVTPMGAVLDALSGGSLSLTLRETTVMALNPTT